MLLSILIFITLYHSISVYHEWLGSVGSTEFQLTLDKKLELYKAYKKEHDHLRWMANLRGLKVSEEGQAWANQTFHPQLYANGVKKIAFVMPEDALYLLDNEQLTPHMII